MSKLQRDAMGNNPIREAVMPIFEAVNPTPESLLLAYDPEDFSPEPEAEDVAVAEMALASGVPANLADIIAKLVKTQVDDALAREADKQRNGTRVVDMKPGALPALPTFKKHYRCDLSPQLHIQRLDMNVLRAGQDPRKYPLPGKWIVFRLGHLYTSDDDVIAQVEWMRAKPKTPNERAITYGGNRGIYEDDGSVLYHCTEGCEYVTASFSGWRAHMSFTHGYEFPEG